MSLPEYLIEQKEEAIRQRMLDSLPPGLDKAEGSYIWDALSPAAIELTQAALWAQEVLQRGFASTTFGEYLDLRCGEHGLTRRGAVKAAGQVTFTVSGNTYIPAGTLVATPADPVAGEESRVFATAAGITIEEEGNYDLNIVAVEAGAGGNVITGAISILVNPVPGVTSVTNTAATTGGTDTESDASLLARYYARVQTPGTSGNKADYINWALEVPGVGAVQVIPLWNGAGTVKVVLLGTDKQPADSVTVTNVQNYIAPADGAGEGKAPIGADVTVVYATKVDINVTASMVLTGTKTMAEVTAAFEKSLIEYLSSIAFTNDPTVSYIRIGSLLIDTDGVKDCPNYTINGEKVNITINTGEVGVKGAVALS
ncbi:MAG: Baseplate J family protein [Peptococcaceae bacterium BICA1-7]|nr:MAG: Baseplate J family protein [Peptococcaceae bacterium BICA1-7]HBV95631.1 Baseplate J family protein [Desulfotomaculum sp.]